jgi:transcriptional regulator with PAS, ATPase and Fis domain
MLCTEGDVIEPKDLNIDTTPLEKKYLDLLPPPALGFDLNKFIGTVRAHQIRKALSMSDGNEKRAADLLGISRQAVNEFLKKHADELA